MSTPSDLKRQQFPLPDGHPQEKDDESNKIRIYYSPSHNVPPLPSVSVIKGLRADPEKEDALAGWRQRFDGQSKWGRPWWKDQQIFKGLRGTLIHFAILNHLGDASGDTYFHEVGDSDWGQEEYWAEYNLKKWSTKAPSANTDDVPYVPRGNKYDGEHAWDRTVRDMKWATRTFKKEIIDSGHLDPDNVLDVESFVYDREYGYGGQYDLLYERDGKVILSDLKTSSAVRFDHKLQSAAYKRAVELQRGITIDECEVLRLHPDKENVEISQSPDWDRSLQGLENQFLGLCDVAHQKAYSDVLETAKVELMESREKTEQTELSTAT